MKDKTIGERYLQVRESLDKIALEAARHPSEIKLVAVSKNHPIEKILAAYDAGCRDFGESRVQESLKKKPLLPNDAKLHLIGTLQKNKVNQSLGNYELIHSVDTPILAELISNAGMKRGIITPVLIQVNISGEATKHGFSGTAWEPYLEMLSALKGIQLAGLMTIGPNTSDEKAIRSSFASLRERLLCWQKTLGNSETFKHLSMGMSLDYPLAIKEGATIIRIGTAIFGERIVDNKH